MKAKNAVRQMVVAAMLTALGIVIPMFMPGIKLPPASYTLASHVPIFLGVFMSPLIGVVVAIGTTLGFLLTAPITVVMRAASHILWVVPMAVLLHKNVFSLKKPVSLIAMSLIIAVFHALFESVVVLPFVADWQSIIWLLLTYAGGYVAHSLLDFYIAYAVYAGLHKARLV